MKFISKGEPEKKHRLIILTDMENEPDDSQTMVKLLMYANEVDIEGLIAVTSVHLPNMVFPESIVDRVNAYGVVRDHLMLHAPGWPTATELLEKVAGGQRGYGMSAVGTGKSSPGSEQIIRAVDKKDPRPIWVAVNAGSNTLAQALWDVRERRSLEEVKAFVSKLRVYDDSGQDDAGAWMCSQFPDLFYIRSRYQVFGLFGPDEKCGPDVTYPLDHYHWAELNVRTRHGVLGALYPQRFFSDGRFAFMDGGGTTTWLGLVNKGLFDPDHITWGGWGGRFSDVAEQVPAGQMYCAEEERQYGSYRMYPQAADTSFTCDANRIESGGFMGFADGTRFDWHYFAPLWRWRDAYLADFKARMDWCVTDYLHANHHPAACLFGDANRTVARFTARAGEACEFDASGSYDPDDRVRFFEPVKGTYKEQIDFKWYCYPEAGTYKGEVNVEEADSPVARVRIPMDAAGTQIHIILEVRDRDGKAPLRSYRRIVIDVEA